MNKGSTLIVVIILLPILVLAGSFLKQYVNNQTAKEQLSNLPKDYCLDSDGGQDHGVNGTIKYQKYDDKGSITATSDVSDDCVNTVIGGKTKYALREYYCDSNSRVQYQYFVCPKGCSKGRCLK